MTDTRRVRAGTTGPSAAARNGRWEIRIQDPVTGKRRSAYAKSETEARRRLREMVTKAEQGVSTLDSAMRLDAYLEAWLKTTQPGRRAESTMREYERRSRTHVMPAIGHRRLRSLTVVDVEQMLQRSADQRLGRELIRGVRNAQAAALTDAKRQRLITANVATNAVLPQTTARKPKPPATVSGVQDLLEAARGTEMGDLLAVLAGTGCRIGEALGATWADLDLAGGSGSCNGLRR